MPKIRYLKVRFANNIFAGEIPYFRAAVIQATEGRSSLFHNHQPEDPGVIYRYPLIQYKVSEKKATIVCLNEGTDDIHHLFGKRYLNLRIGKREEQFEIEDIHLNYFNVQRWQARFSYALKDWQALNQENFRRYEQIGTERERLAFLENILRANLLSFANGVGWQVDGPLTAGITRLKGVRRLPFKGRKVLAFTLNFQTNVSLPDYLGLGKGVSIGFGSIKRFGKIESLPQPAFIEPQETSPHQP